MFGNEDYYQCTYGFDTTNEADAIRHAAQWHASKEELKDVERLKVRIRVMVSTLFSDWSFDRELYERGN